MFSLRASTIHRKSIDDVDRRTKRARSDLREIGLLDNASTLESTVQLAAWFCKAEAVLVYVRTDRTYETIRSSPPFLIVRRRRKTMDDARASVLQAIPVLGEGCKVCRRGSEYTLLGAKAGGGFQSSPILVPRDDQFDVRGVLTVNRSAPCLFDIHVKKLLIVLSGVISSALVEEEAKEEERNALVAVRSQQIGTRTSNGRQSLLSRREIQIGRFLANDLKYKEIASKLNLSIRTVEHHVERLKLRTGVSTLQGLIAFLLRTKLTEVQ
jgi:DNA-binding NarL/FixJ family response regulator